MGGSTPVALNLRIRVWLEMVPVLLRKLDVEHVSLLTHSAGTVYTLDTLVHLPSILDPQAPYVGFIGKQHLRSLLRRLENQLTSISTMGSNLRFQRHTHDSRLQTTHNSDGLVVGIARLHQFQSHSSRGFFRRLIGLLDISALQLIIKHDELRAASRVV